MATNSSSSSPQTFKRARKSLPNNDDEIQEEEQQDEEQETIGEYEELLADNESLMHERTQLLSTFLKLTHALEQCESMHDPSLIKENQELSAELAAHRMLVESLRGMTDEHGGNTSVGGGGSGGSDTMNSPIMDSLDNHDDTSSLHPNSSMLQQLAEEAEMKLMRLVSASQDPRNKWVRAVFPDLPNLPSFFHDLIFHYQCGRDFISKEEAEGNVNMRFDVFFPGFTPSVVSEISWRLFVSEEHSRRIMRDDNLKLSVVEDKVDPTSGERIRVLRMRNSLKRPQLQKTVSTTLVCLKTRRTLPKSTLHPPQRNKSGIPQHGGLLYPSSSTSTTPQTQDHATSRYGNVDCYFTSNSSSLLYALDDEHDDKQPRDDDDATGTSPPQVVAQKLQGNLIQGSIIWSEGDGARIVVLVSFPKDYIHEGETAAKRFEADASVKGAAVTVSKWLTKLVEHATSQFVSYVLEETLHRRGRDLVVADGSRNNNSSQDAASQAGGGEMSSEGGMNGGGGGTTEKIRVATVSPAASSFLKSLVRPANKGNKTLPSDS